MEALLQEFIKAFGWSILNSVWQSGIIYAVLLTVMLVAPKLSAKIRHNLAFGALCSMFVWFLYTFVNHVNFSQPVFKGTPQDFAALNYYVNQLPQTLSQKAEGYFPLIVTAYLAGILIQLFVILRGYLFIKKLKTTQLSAVPAEWAALFAAITSSLGMSRKIRFELSALVNVPVVVGYLKPFVLFPVSLVTQLDNEQVEAILIHELSHIRRNDYLLNLIKTCIETLMFFNPFIWLAGKFIHIEREHACDDLVLKLSGKPLTYAHALLKLELVKDSVTPAYALAATGKTQYLYQRIKRITNMKTNYLNTKQQMAALTLAAAGLLSVAWTNPVVKEKAKEVTHKITQTLSLTSESPKAISLTVASDTTKKKTKMKIIITDDKGVTKEYNSIAEMPDSLKNNFATINMNGNYVYSLSSDSLRFGKGIYLMNDSIFAPRFKAMSRTLNSRFNSPEAKARWEKISKEMEKEFNSPEAKAKWEKMSKDFEKAFNSPEAKAQWDKLSKEMEKEFNSPETKAKWEKLAREFKGMNGLVYGTGNVVRFDTLLARFKPTMGMNIKLDSFTRIFSDGRSMAMELTTKNNLKSRVRVDSLLSKSIYTFDSKNKYNMPFVLLDKDLQNSEEYKKLKEKFQQDVEELRKKKKATGKDTDNNNNNNDEKKPALKSTKKVGYVSVTDNVITVKG